MKKVINKFGIQLEVGDKLLIIEDRINDKVLANVDINEIITISGFSDDGKIMYHHNSLALPVNCNIYKKLDSDKNNE
jgi:hypothetical protein